MQIPSDNVPFNELPDMKAAEITAAGKEALVSKRFDMVRINYANPDMVRGALTQFHHCPLHSHSFLSSCPLLILLHVKNDHHSHVVEPVHLIMVVARASSFVECPVFGCVSTSDDVGRLGWKTCFELITPDIQWSSISTSLPASEFLSSTSLPSLYCCLVQAANSRPIYTIQMGRAAAMISGHLLCKTLRPP